MSIGFARELVREPKPAAPPEAFWVVSKRVFCSMVALVDPDGRVVHAKVDRCPAVLAESAIRAARTARFAAHAERTAEEMEVEIRAPGFTPAPKKGRCIAAFRVSNTLQTLPSHPKCPVQTTPWKGTTTAAATSKWCAFDLTPDARPIAVSCSDGIPGAAEVVKNWQVERPTRVLLEFAR